MISHKKVKGISLGSLEPSICSLLFKWRNDPSLFKWFRQNDVLAWNQHEKWFNEHQNDKSIKMYGIYSDNTVVGVCGLTSIDLQNQRAEFSIYISTDYHGNGYGPKALKLLLWHGFNSYPLNLIWGETFSGNPALKTFKEIGFKEDGVRREFYFKEGKFINCHLISIKRNEFVI